MIHHKNWCFLFKWKHTVLKRDPSAKKKNISCFHFSIKFFFKAYFTHTNTHCNHSTTKKTDSKMLWKKRETQAENDKHAINGFPILLAYFSWLKPPTTPHFFFSQGCATSWFFLVFNLLPLFLEHWMWNENIIETNNGNLNECILISFLPFDSLLCVEPDHCSWPKVQSKGNRRSRKGTWRAEIFRIWKLAPYPSSKLLPESALRTIILHLFEYTYLFMWQNHGVGNEFTASTWTI